MRVQGERSAKPPEQSSYAGMLDQKQRKAEVRSRRREERRKCALCGTMKGNSPHGETLKEPSRVSRTEAAVCLMHLDTQFGGP